MQLKEIPDMVRAVQAAVEMHYGLPAQPGEVYYPDKALRPLCKQLGVGLFAAELVLHSPTGRPVLGLSLSWTFRASRGGDEDDDDNWEQWSWGLLGCGFQSQAPPLTAETQVRKVDLVLSYKDKARPEDIIDLRVRVRDALKEGFPDVTINLRA